ncbi:MAG TPA: RMD1 family protein [Kofleriaceae bacterium]|nr:RMD1 family protein [Kofleriaceae bacterium]
MAHDVAARLGTRFEVRALNLAGRIDIRGVDPRMSPHLPVIIEVAPSGYAVLLRSGVVVLFGIDPIQQERFVADLGSRIQDRYEKPEVERATVRVGDADGVEPDAIIVKEVTVGRLQVIAEALGKSAILARYEEEIADAFRKIEPLAVKMRESPRRLPWKQPQLVAQIGEAILAEHQLVGSAEVTEKPDLLWDHPELDRFYIRLEDEYEIRERHHAIERKLAVVSNTARTMLELSQTKRSLNVEYYIVALIVMELLISLYELVWK